MTFHFYEDLLSLVTRIHLSVLWSVSKRSFLVFGQEGGQSMMTCSFCWQSILNKPAFIFILSSVLTRKKKFGKLEGSGNLKVFQPNSNSCAHVHMNKAPGSNFQEASQRCCRSHIALLADVFLSSIPALRYLLFEKKRYFPPQFSFFPHPQVFYRMVRLLPNTSCFILLVCLQL